MTRSLSSEIRVLVRCRGMCIAWDWRRVGLYIFSRIYLI